MKPMLSLWQGLILSLAALSFSATAQNGENASPEDAPKPNPVVRLETSLGPVDIELFQKEAPISAANFLQYVESGFYDGVIFHRVVPGFVVQAGGFDAKFKQKETGNPIMNESKLTVKNLRGTLSMARTSAPNSATSQFFINLQDNPSLDALPGRPGYAVFGRVTDGMAVVDKMTQQPQGQYKGTFVNAPNEPIVIKKATVLGEQPAQGEQ